MIFNFFQFAEKRLEGIDILVLNHYILQYGKWFGTPENVTDLYQTMDINFYAYIMTATHALPALKKSKGNIIVMNSNMGKSSNGNIQAHTYLLKEYRASFHEYWLPYSLVTARK